MCSRELDAWFSRDKIQRLHAARSALTGAGGSYGTASLESICLCHMKLCSSLILLERWEWRSGYVDMKRPLHSLANLLPAQLVKKAERKLFHRRAGHSKKIFTFWFPFLYISGGVSSKLLRQQLTEGVVAVRWCDPFTFGLPSLQCDRVLSSWPRCNHIVMKFIVQGRR